MTLTVTPGKASATRLGLVKVSTGLAIDSAGNLTTNLSASDVPNLPASKITSGTLDLARLSGITHSELDAAAGITAGQIASVNPSTLTGSGTVPAAGLPVATSSALGAIKVGSGLSISSGVLSVTGGSGGVGSVTSVDMSVPSILTLSGNPITSSGTFAVDLATQAANVILSGPTTGTAIPTFRALVAADIPSLAASKITSGTFGDAYIATGITASKISGALSNATIAGSAITGSAGLADSVLSANVPLLNANNAFTTAGSAASSGTPALFSITPTLTQSGTAGYTAFKVYATETSTGSGTKLIADFGIGSTSKGSIDDTGFLTATTIDATKLTGAVPSGSLTSVPAASLTGTVALARLSGITTTQLDSAAGILSAQIAALDAAKITSGTLPLARLSAITTSQLSATAGIVGTQLDAAAAIASGQITSLAASKITGSGTLPDGVLSSNVPLLNAANTFTALQTATAFAPTGLTGSTAATRYVGGTASVAPTSGAHNVGDWVITQAGSIYICTTAGTPGTWTAVSGGGSSSPLTTKGDLHSYSTTDARMAVGADGTFLAADSSQSTGLAYKFPAGVAGVSTLSTALSADVTMTSANTYYDGPSLTLTAGTWLLLGALTLEDNVAASNFTIKLWDGTTVTSSACTSAPSPFVDTQLAIQGVVTPSSTTTYKISASCTGAGNKIKAAAYYNAAGNTASFLQAIQLTGAPASGPGALMPAVRCYNSANISIPNSGGGTTLTFDGTRYDQGTSTAQHSTSSNTSRLTCQQAGVYQITGCINFANSSTGTRDAWILLNGTTTIGELDETIVGTSGPYLTVTTQYKLAVGDYVELVVYQNTGSSLNVLFYDHTSPEFMMARIDSGPGAVQPNTKVQLDYALASDLSSQAYTAAAWTDIIGNQTFTVDDVNSVVEISVSGYILTSNNASAGNTGASAVNGGIRLVIDSAGTPVNKMVGGFRVNGADYTNALAGADTVTLTGLSVGSHTVKLQIYQTANTGSGLFCRPSTHPNEESLQIRVLERKQSSSPPSSTPAPAVRCYNSANISTTSGVEATLTFDTTRLDQGTSTPQHSTSSNTSRLTCQQTGLYNIQAMIVFANNATGVRYAYFHVNGGTIIGHINESATNGGVTALTMTTLYQLSVGDYVEVVVNQTSGGALNVSAAGNYSPEFMMCRVDTGGTGAVYVPTVKTANYTILATDSMVVASANSLTLTLPAASAYTGKAPLTIKNDNFTSTTVARAGSDTIDGATSYSLSSAYASAQFVSDGNATWRVV